MRRLKAQPDSTPGRAAPEPVYEVRRILKAFVDAQWLAEFDARLAAYQAQLTAPNSANSTTSEPDDE